MKAIVTKLTKAELTKTDVFLYPKAKLSKIVLDIST